MPSFQSYVAMGPLVRDVEVRQSEKGTSWAMFTIVVQVGYGEKKYPLWLNCKCFGKAAESMSRFNLTKGQHVIVNGELRRDEYEKDGEKKVSYWVSVNNWSFAERRGDGGERSSGSSRAKAEKPSETLADWAVPKDKAAMADDEIPF